MRLETFLFQTGEYGLYLAVLVSFLALLLRKTARGGPAAKGIRFAETLAAIVSFAVLAVITVMVVARTVRTGHSPFTSMYEFSVSFVWGILLVGGLFFLKYRNLVIQCFVLAIALLLMRYAAALPSASAPLVPALQNNLLLAAHVFSAVIAYGAFTVGFAASVLLLVQQNNRFRSLPAKEKLEGISYHSVVIGFPFMTLVIVLGAIWADVAWGSFWSWDPKETASLITWLLYAGYLHARVLRKWKGKYSAILLIVGFVAVLFTFFGNYLFGGCTRTCKPARLWRKLN